MEPTLEGKRINLRRVTLKDADSIVKYANDKTICDKVPMPYPYKKKDAVYFIKRSHRNRKNDKEYQLGIEWKETGEIIGMMGLMEIDRKNKNLEIGYWVGKKFWRKGIATEALKLVLDFIFKKLKFEKAWATVNSFNKPSQGLLKSVGFKEEGIIRNFAKYKGKYINKHHFGMLKKEYKK